MSRARVITGTDDRGRPVSEWAPAPLADPPFGFMEPAIAPTVTRRKATRAELAASLARDTATGYLGAKPDVTTTRLDLTWSAEAAAQRMRVSRARGVTRSHKPREATA